MSLVPYKVTAIKKTDPTGNNVLPLASVAIVKSGGGYAQLWDDEAGTIARGNPFQVDSNGERQVWLNGGEYNVSVAGGQSWDIKLTGGSDILTIENVAALSTFTPVAGQVYYLKEYNSGTGKGGGDLLAKSGAITPNNVTTFASGTAGVYFERINISSIHADMAGALPDTGVSQYVPVLAACNAAMDLGYTDVYFDYGIYLFHALFPIWTKPIRLIGRGNGDRGSPVAVNKGTEFRYTGEVTNNFLLSFKEIWYGGAGIENITIYCDNRCSGFVIDSCCGMKFDNVSVKDDSYLGVLLTATTTTTCSWNHFTNLLIDDYLATGGLAAMHLDGGPGLGNACHNTWMNLRINHNNARQGVLLGYCDNNSFYMSFIYKVGGAGYSIYGDTTKGGGFPGNNVFFHVQAIGGCYQDAGSIFPMAAYYGYQQDNGEPLPVNAGNATATPIVITDNGRYFGIREITMRARTDQNDYGNATITSGATFVDITIPEVQQNNFWVGITPTNNSAGATWWVSNTTTTGFRVNISSALGGNWNFQYEIRRFKSN